MCFWHRVCTAFTTLWGETNEKSRLRGVWFMHSQLALARRVVVALIVISASCATQKSNVPLTDEVLPPQRQAEIVTAAQEPDAATKATLQAAYGKLPLSFEANQGQTDEAVQFLSRGSGYTLFLTAGEAVLAL